MEEEIYRIKEKLKSRMSGKMDREKQKKRYVRKRGSRY